MITSIADGRFYREMGIRTDPPPSVTALMELHNQAIERLRAQHAADLAILTEELTQIKRQNATLRSRADWLYKALFAAGLFLAYLARG